MKKWLLMVALVVAAAAVAAGVIVWQPGATSSPLTQDSTQQSAAGEGWSATASFPGHPGLRARVQPASPDDRQAAAYPAATTLRALADFSVEGGQFPASGAQVSFTLDEPVAGDRIPVIAHWNEAGELWEPVETSLSEDRRTATAAVAHFSPYGFFDYLFNAVGQVTGNAATSGVTCDQPAPGWADPQFFDDINSPILWCGGRDTNNADLLVAKVKMNRDTAAKVTLAIDPAWAWSDLWKASPTDLATMAAAAELPSSPFGQREYLIQPFGEMHFGFSRSALEGLYYGAANRPLIQVETGWFYTAAAIMWDQIGDMSPEESPIAAVSSTMAMLECGQGLLTATSGTGAVDAFGKAMTCLGTQQSKDLLHRGVHTVLGERYQDHTRRWVSYHSKKVITKLGLIGLGMKTADFSLKIFSAAGDATLPENVRQFKFEPSLQAMKDRASQKKTNTVPQPKGGTEIVEVNPWSDPAGPTGANVVAGGSSDSDPLGGICYGSNLVSRADAFRCFPEGAGVYDPCFSNPADTASYACLDKDPSSWIIFTGLNPQVSPGRTTAPDRAPFYFELANGMRCRLASGAGPNPPQGYDGWAGVCSTEDRSKTAVLWADSRLVSKNGNSIYTGKGPQGHWQVAVGDEGASPERIDVVRGYR